MTSGVVQPAAPLIRHRRHFISKMWPARLISTVPKRFDDDQPLAAGSRFGKHFMAGARNRIQQERRRGWAASG
jgi:hypothetical protein